MSGIARKISEGSESVGVWPYHEADEIAAASAVLASGRVNYWNGSEGRAFEKEFSGFCGRKFGVALANGTLALELAMRALDIGEGAEVIVPSRTFVATATSVIAVGATPVFVDVDRDSGNLSAASVKGSIGRETRAIIPVHLGGWPCPMAEILEVAREDNLYVIEDCAQAHGARIDDNPIGSFGDAGAFSFCTDKIMTTGGEGGMLIMDDEDAWQLAWSYKDHGRSFDAVYNREHPPGFRWLIESFGSNWRLTEMQSAIGRIQLRKLDQWVEMRARNAQRIAEALAQHRCVRVPMPPANYRHAYYKLYAYVRPELLKANWSRDRVLAEFNEQGLPGLSGSCSEIYLEKAFKDAGLQPKKRLPVAKELGETSLMFQVHPTLTDSDISFTCDVIGSVLGRAGA